MKIIVLLFAVLFIASCGSTRNESSTLPSKQILANRVRNKTIHDLKKEKELYACGAGARIMNQIKVLSLSFNYYKEIDIEKSRELLLFAGNVFLNNINSDEQIRSYLNNYPATPENIGVIIFIKNPDGSLTEKNKFTAATMLDGIFCYYIRSPETGHLKMVYEETYEEAVSKANHLAACF